MPPQGLLSIATVLRDEGHEAEVYDMATLINKHGVPINKDIYSNVAEQIVEEGKSDIYGFSCIATLEISAVRIAQVIKEKCPRSIIVFGNINASVNAAAYLNMYEWLDYVVCGEGELTTLELCNSLASGRNPHGLDGVASKCGGRVVKGGVRPLCSDLDSLPAPDYDLLRYGVDWYGCEGRAKEGIIPVGRGCGYNCSYCTTPGFWRRNVRYFSPGRIVAEVVRCREMGFEVANFDVDNFGTSRGNAVAICESLINAGVPLPWRARSRLDCLDDELLDLMHASGCKTVLVGVESGDATMLERMNKQSAIGDPMGAVRRVSEHGVGAVCSFVVGHPGETMESVCATYRRACECAAMGRDNQSGVHYLSPLPGTAVTLEAIERSELRLSDNTLVSPDFAQYLEWVKGKSGRYERFVEDHDIIAGNLELFSSYGHVGHSDIAPEVFALCGSYLTYLMNLYPKTMCALMASPMGGVKIYEILLEHNNVVGCSIDDLLSLREYDIPKHSISIVNRNSRGLVRLLLELNEPVYENLFNYESMAMRAERNCVVGCQSKAALNGNTVCRRNYETMHAKYDFDKIIEQFTKMVFDLNTVVCADYELISTIKAQGAGVVVETRRITDSLAWVLGTIDGRTSCRGLVADFCAAWGGGTDAVEEELYSALTELDGFVLW